MSKLRTECQIAIIAYTMDSNLYADFNDKCRRLQGDNSWNNFPYKSLYALLARSIHDIDNDPPVTTKMFYRGMSHKVKNLKVGDCFFLKQFMSCTPVKHMATMFVKGSGTLMIFEGSPSAACGLAKLSDFPSEQEILLFPWNVIRVTKIVSGQQQDNVHFETVESFVKDLPYSGNYKSRGIAVNNSGVNTGGAGAGNSDESSSYESSSDESTICILYTYDSADDMLCVDL